MLEEAVMIMSINSGMDGDSCEQWQQQTPKGGVR